MHKKRAAQTVRFGDVRDSFVLSSGSNYEPDFSMTDAPENWWRTSRFAKSGRFRAVDKDKVRGRGCTWRRLSRRMLGQRLCGVVAGAQSRLPGAHARCRARGAHVYSYIFTGTTQLQYPRVGQYEPPASCVQLGSPSLTRPSFMPRRPRVTAPATGATAEARKWGADKWLEEPEPGPGHYNAHGSTMHGGEKGCSSYFMRSKGARFKNDRDHGAPRGSARSSASCPPPFPPSSPAGHGAALLVC